MLPRARPAPGGYARPCTLLWRVLRHTGCDALRHYSTGCDVNTLQHAATCTHPGSHAYTCAPVCRCGDGAGSSPRNLRFVIVTGGGVDGTTIGIIIGVLVGVGLLGSLYKQCQRCGSSSPRRSGYTPTTPRTPPPPTAFASVNPMLTGSSVTGTAAKRTAADALAAVAALAAAATPASAWQQPQPWSPALLMQLDGALRDFIAAPWTSADAATLSSAHAPTVLALLRSPAAAGAVELELLLHALYWLTGTAEARSAVGAAGAVDTVVRVFRAPVTVGVAIRAADVLARLAMDDALEIAVANGGAPAAALRLLAAPAATAPEALAACRLLAALTWAAPNKRALVVAGAPRALLAALAGPHVGSAVDIARHGANALARLAAEPGVEADVVAHDGLGVLLRLLHGPAGAGADAAGALLAALSACTQAPAHAALALNMGAAAAAVAALRGPGRADADAAARACRALGTLALANDRAVVHAGGAAAVLALLSGGGPLAADGNVAKDAAWALQCMTQSVDAAAAVAALGAAPVAERLRAAPPGAASATARAALTDSCAVVLANLARRPEAAKDPGAAV